jgi:molybdopterin-guanine dinucleotide biosynthesis protein B
MIPIIPLVTIVGKSGTGKTTLIEKLLKELKMRKYKVATIKHTHSFEMDKPGKDTWRHAQAGADTVIISGHGRIAMIKKAEQEWELDQLTKLSPDVDLFLVEGFKYSTKPKIEVFRREHCSKLLSLPEQLIAVASDVHLDVPGVPVLDINDARGLVDIIEEKIIKKR